MTGAVNVIQHFPDTEVILTQPGFFHRNFPFKLQIEPVVVVKLHKYLCKLPNQFINKTFRRPSPIK